MKTSIFTLITLILLSSCSVVKKNGYYQSRSYKAKKHVHLTLFKKDKERSTKPSNNANCQAVLEPEEIIPARTDIDPQTPNCSTAQFARSSSLETKELLQSFEKQSIDQKISSLHLNSERKKDQTQTNDNEEPTNDDATALLHIFTIMTAIGTIIGVITVGSFSSFLVGALPIALCLFLYFRSQSHSDSTATKTFVYGLYLLSLTWAGLIIVFGSTPVIIAIFEVAAVTFFFAAFIILIVSIVLFLKEYLDQRSEGQNR